MNTASLILQGIIAALRAAPQIVEVATEAKNFVAALFTANHLRVKAIAALTQSGSTALWMSRHNAGCPIFALTPEVSAQRRMALYRNVRPLYLEQSSDREGVLRAAEDLLLAKGQVQMGDMIVLTNGEPMGKSGGTNALKIVRVGEHR